MEREGKTVIAHRELWVDTEQELLFEEFEILENNG